MRRRNVGAVGGVIVPSLVVSTGALLYLPLAPALSGAGLTATLAATAAMHVLALLTALGMASLASDEKVSSSGESYFLSRSVGLTAGSTLAVAQIVTLSLLAALLVLVATGSLLSFFGRIPEPGLLRACAGAGLLALCIVALAGKRVASALQYLVLVAVAGALASVVVGSLGGVTWPPPRVPVLGPPPAWSTLGAPFMVLFPAAAWLLIGVSRSEELRLPTRSIPRGLLVAFVVGVVAHACFGFVLVSYASPDVLRSPGAMVELATHSLAARVGAWAGALGAALVSLLGAASMLQALAADGLAVRWLGGAGSAEPRRALPVVLLPAAAAVASGDAALVGRLVVFALLSTFLLFNAIHAFSSIGSATFRPRLRVWPGSTFLGAAAAMASAVALDRPAGMVAAFSILALLLIVARRRLVLDADDPWDGLWASLVRAGLWRLSRSRRHGGRFLPNILLFRTGINVSMRELAASVAIGGGVVTEFELSAQAGGDDDDPPGEPVVGVFHRRLVAGDPHTTIVDVCRHRGFSVLEPNTVLLDWTQLGDEPARLRTLIGELMRLDKNLLLYASDARADAHAERRIDVWWRPGAGNVPLSIALVRLLGRGRAFRGVKIRLLMASSAQFEQLRSTARVLLQEAGVDATVEVVDERLRGRSFEELVRSASADSMLTVLGLPNDSPGYGDEYHAQIGRLRASLHAIVMLHGSSAFEPVLQASARSPRSSLPAPAVGAAELPAIELPATPRVAAIAARLAEAQERLAESFFESCLLGTYGRESALVGRIKESIEAQFDTLDKNLAKANPRRRQKLLNRFHSSLLLDCGKLLAGLTEKELAEQHAALDAGINAALSGAEAIDLGEVAAVIEVERPREQLAPATGRGAERPSGAAPQDVVRNRVPLAALRAYYIECSIGDMLLPAIRGFARSSHQLMAEVGKTLGAITLDLAVPDGDDISDDELLACLAEQRRLFVERLGALIEQNDEDVARHHNEICAASRQIVRSFAADADRLDAERFARRERQVRPRDAGARRSELRSIASGWSSGQKLVVERARLGLELASFQQRLLAAVRREKRGVALMMRTGMLGECERLVAALEGLRATLKSHATAARKGLDAQVDVARHVDVDEVIERLTRTSRQLAADLPHIAQTLTDSSLEQLLEGRTNEVQTVSVPVLRLVQFLLETKLVGPLQAALETIPPLEQRAASLAQDAMRLVAFQIGELEDEDLAAGDLVIDPLNSVVENGIKRLGDEIERLKAAQEETSVLVDKQLDEVVQATTAYELTRASADLEQLIRKHKGERAVSIAWSLLDRGAESLEIGLAKLLYRRSEAMLVARQLGQARSRGDRLVDRVMSVVHACTPDQEVLERLPFYYRQLFLGEAAVNDAFWVGRQRELDEARRAIVAFGQGSHGPLLITGERGSGKSSLMMRITSSDRGRRQVFRVLPPRGGSSHGDDFAASLCRATNIQQTPDRLLAELPPGSILALDDLEMWWERGEAGLAVLDQLLELIERHGDRTLFILALGRQAHTLINGFRPLADRALATLECEPLAAEDLKTIIMLRHASTGATFELAGRGEEELSEWRRARLFSAHFDFCGGWVGPALRSWVTHVRSVTGETLAVVAPGRRNSDVLDELRPEWSAILVQLMVHKQLARPRLRRIAGGCDPHLDHHVDGLIRTGMVTESRHDVVEVDPFIHHLLLERFVRRGMLV